MIQQSQPEFPVYSRKSFKITQGQGALLSDEFGKEYLDFYGGHAVTALGYGHAGWTEAITAQAASLSFQSNAVDLSVRAEACQALVDFAPEGLDRVLLVNSGAEAVENALRMAFLSTGGKKVVALKGAFHGRTAAANACTDKTDGYYAYPQKPFEVEFVEPNDIAALKLAVDDKTAAVIAESIQGIAGARPLSAEFIGAIRSLCDDTGALYIADEVQCGMGRSGDAFGFEFAGVVPDIMTLAKGLGAGFPVGAVVAKAALADALKIGQLGTTFGGGPMACAAIKAVVTAIRTENLLKNVQERSALILAEGAVGPVEKVQGRGLLLGFQTKGPAKEVIAALEEKGILVGSSTNAQVFRIMPPLTINQDQVGQFVAALAEIKL